jgi:hypothetical protein
MVGAGALDVPIPTALQRRMPTGGARVRLLYEVTATHCCPRARGTASHFLLTRARVRRAGGGGSAALPGTRQGAAAAARTARGPLGITGITSVTARHGRSRPTPPPPHARILRRSTSTSHGCVVRARGWWWASGVWKATRLSLEPDPSPPSRLRRRVGVASDEVRRSGAARKLEGPRGGDGVGWGGAGRGWALDGHTLQLPHAARAHL